MKKYITFLLPLFVLLNICTLQAQQMNWNWADTERPHHLHLNLGYDFGLSTQLGYNYLLSTKLPVLLTADYAFPMGKKVVDDFKVRVGGQIEVFSHQNFSASVKLFGTLKRHETELVRMVNLGTETSVLAGYYHPKWHVAGEIGFMKPMVSNVKHGEVMRENHPDIQDGWYAAPGGHLFYGIQAGKSLSQTLDLSLRIGATKAPGDHKDAVIARYAQLGLIVAL